VSAVSRPPLRTRFSVRPSRWSAPKPPPCNMSIDVPSPWTQALSRTSPIPSCRPAMPRPTGVAVPAYDTGRGKGVMVRAPLGHRRLTIGPHHMGQHSGVLPAASWDDFTRLEPVRQQGDNQYLPPR
jgi:hypothetical protein